MNNRNDDPARRDWRGEDGRYNRRGDEQRGSYGSYRESDSRRGEFDRDYNSSERDRYGERDSMGNAGRGNNDYRGRVRYEMPGSERYRDRREEDLNYGWSRRDSHGYDRGAEELRRGGESDRRGERDRYDERRTRGYDPGQGSDYHESGLRSFDYDSYAARDRYQGGGTRDRDYDQSDRDRSSHDRFSERGRDDDRERGRYSDRDDRSERGRYSQERSGSEGSRGRSRDISGTWRQFDSWGRESYGDQRGQGIGWHRRDAYHSDFWDQDEGPRER